MALYAVLGCGSLLVVLLTFALVRESRLRRALARLLALFLQRERRPNEVVPRATDPADDGDRLRRS